jgi:hypothetical protein
LAGVNRRHAAQATALVMALMLFGLGMASLARLTDPTHRVVRVAPHNARQVPRADEAPGADSAGGPPVVSVVARAYTAPPQVFPRPASSQAPASRPHGADALGTSVSKRRRWATLGGHGRNGAG